MKKFDDTVNSLIKSMREKPEFSEAGKKTKYFDSSPDYELVMETASVFRYDRFSRLIDYIFSIPDNDIPKIMTQDDMKLLGLNVSKFRKKGVEAKDKDLCIIKLDLKDSSYANKEKFLGYLKQIDSQAELNPRVFKIVASRAFDNLIEVHAGGAYMKFQKDMGILFCSTDNDEKTKEIIYHELIHYLQDVTGNGQPDIESIIEHNGSAPKFMPLQLLSKMTREIDGLPSNVIENLLNAQDVVAYLNNIALIFQKNGATAEEALEVVNSLIREANSKEGETRKDQVIYFLNKLSNDIPLLKGIKGGELEALILILVFKQHRTLLKKTIGNYLKKTRK